MRKQTIDENRRCPKCGRAENKSTRDTTGQARSAVFANFAITNTLNGKTREYPEETKRQAIKTYYSGVSGRGVGKLMGIGKGTVYNWIKKNG